jgi:hypothetical protein
MGKFDSRVEDGYLDPTPVTLGQSPYSLLETDPLRHDGMS